MRFFIILHSKFIFLSIFTVVCSNFVCLHAIVCPDQFLMDSIMKKLFIAIFALTFILAGCASVDLENKEQSEAAKIFKQPDPDKAGIYVYRPSTIAGDGMRLDVYLDGDCLGATGPNVFLYKEVPANIYHTVASESVVSPNELKVYISGGKNYFFRQTPTVEGLIYGIYTAKLAEVTESVGKKAISKMDQGKTGKCYSDFHLSTLFD